MTGKSYNKSVTIIPRVRLYGEILHQLWYSHWLGHSTVYVFYTQQKIVVLLLLCLVSFEV